MVDTMPTPNPVPATDIELQVDFMESQLNMLHDSLDELFDMLDPLLKPPTPEEATDGMCTKVPQSSVIGNRVRFNAERLETLRYRVNAIRHRL